MSKNIVLVGLSGSGKTTIGNLLAKITDFKFIDTDELIVQKEKRTINEIFAVDGEKYFRKVETEITQEISNYENQIISTGGGIILNKINLENLKKKGIVFYLKTSPETLVNRLKGDTTRPLLKTKDVKLKLEKMLEIRGELYEQADFTIETDDLSEQLTADKILEIYND